MNVMEVDISEFLNGRTIKMENAEVIFGDNTVGTVETDPLSVMPQFVNDTDLGLIQSGTEILQGPLTVFSEVPNDEDTTQSNDSSDEVIIQLMDIRTTLSKLRTMLENKLAVDLTDYTFWLQDAKMLESHKTLVEQCIKGSGVVQVNIQIRANERKINILDVLKPDEEIVQLPHDIETDNAEPEPNPVLEPCNSNSVQIPHAANVKWIVDGQFKMDSSRSKVPNDPNEWSIHHVKLWIQWAVRQFNMTGIKLSDWHISGKALCAMTNIDFRSKVPSDPGDIFWTHFELLRKCKFIAVIQNDSEMNPIPVTNIINNQPIINEIQDLPAPSAIKKKKLKEPVNLDSIDEFIDYTPVHNHQIQLWQFLLELLTCPDFYHVIQWLGDSGEFILLEPEKVAKLWGARKMKPMMNYEKLSRALRYYYDGDMISKVPCKRFVYKFVCDLKQLIGYTAAELNERVKKARGIIID